MDRMGGRENYRVVGLFVCVFDNGSGFIVEFGSAEEYQDEIIFMPLLFLPIQPLHLVKLLIVLSIRFHQSTF